MDGIGEHEVDVCADGRWYCAHCNAYYATREDHDHFPYERKGTG